MKIAMFGVKGIPYPAGAENAAENIGSRLAARGHRVTVYVRPHYTPASLREYKGMRLVHLPSIPTKHLDAITHSFLACLATAASDADVVHIHGTGSSVFAWLPRLSGKRTIVQSHGLDWKRAKWGRFARWLLRLTDYSTVHFPDRTAAVSLPMAAHYRSLTRRPVAYIPNGVTPRQPVAPDLIHAYGLQGGDYILFAARFVPEKGAHHLIEAYTRLQPPQKLVLAGDGNYADPYAARLKTHASERIIFPGFVRDRLLDELLTNACLYVLPSDIEGMSIGLLEALSAGCCVLTSDIAENRAVVGDAGCYFQAANPADLGAKLAELTSQPQLAAQYRQKARARAEMCFNWDHVTDEFEALYSQ